MNLFSSIGMKQAPERTAEVSVPQQVCMKYFPPIGLKQAPESSEDVMTPRSQCSSTRDGSVDDGTGRTEAPQSSGDNSPRSQLCVGQSDTSSFAEAAYSGDGFDPRWLATTSCEERDASSFSGDGTIANVGRIIDSAHQCLVCSQQFGCASAFHCHMKFMHDEVEQVGEWLPFPSA